MPGPRTMWPVLGRFPRAVTRRDDHAATRGATLTRSPHPTPRRRLLLGVLLATSGLAAQRRPAPAAQAEPLQPAMRWLAEPPPGLPKMPLPADYTPTAAMFTLGERLFHDPQLSSDRTISCASCHPAATGFASPEPRPRGVGEHRAKRHAPALWNRGYGTLQRWDGSSADLETFVLEPIGDQDEMALGVDGALQRLREQPDYAHEFEQVFGGPPTRTALQRSLATFVRGIVAGDAPYDRFLRGDAEAMTAEQRHGQWIFESKGGCWKCHTPPLFTDERFHNTGVGVVDGKPEPGRAVATGDDHDAGQWKTPTLRLVRLTAPFMHDGSLPDLEAVVDFYVRGGNPNDHIDARMAPLPLDAADRKALLLFLRSL